jgi:hypothetical protein
MFTTAGRAAPRHPPTPSTTLVFVPCRAVKTHRDDLHALRHAGLGATQRAGDVRAVPVAVIGVGVGVDGVDVAGPAPKVAW